MKSTLTIMDFLVILISTVLLIDGVDNVLEYALAFILSLVFIKKPDGYIPLIWVSSWFSRMVVLPFVGAFFYYVLLFIISSFAQRSFFKIPKSSKKTVVAICLFVLWILVTLLSSVVPEYDYVIKLAIYVLSLVMMFKYRVSDINGIGKSIVLVSAFSSIFFGLRLLVAPVTYTIENIKDWGTYTWSSITLMPDLNPNTAAQIIVLLSIVILCTIIKFKKYFLVVPLIFNVYTLLELGSRTSFFTIIIVFGVYFLLTSKISLPRKIALILMAIVLYNFSSLFLMESLSNSRIISDSIFEDGGSGRFQNWTALLVNVFPHHWFTGIGIGRESYRALGFVYDADNLYVDLLCQVGLVGFLLFFYIYCVIFKEIYLRIKQNTIESDYLIMFMLAFLFLGIGETVFGTSIYWATLMIVVVCGLGNNVLIKNDII